MDLGTPESEVSSTAQSMREAAARGDIAAIVIADRSIIDDTDDRGNTALMLASKNQHAPAVAVLLGLGANLELENSWGETALWQAVATSRGSGRVISALLAFGADPNHRNHSGVSPRQLARGERRYHLDRFFQD